VACGERGTFPAKSEWHAVSGELFAPEVNGMRPAGSFFRQEWAACGLAKH